MLRDVGSGAEGGTRVAMQGAWLAVEVRVRDSGYVAEVEASDAWQVLGACVSVIACVDDTT